MGKEKTYICGDFAEFLKDESFWSPDVYWDDCLLLINGMEVNEFDLIEHQDSDFLSILSGDIIWDFDLPSNHILKFSSNSYYRLSDAFDIWLESRDKSRIVVIFNKSIDVNLLSEYISKFDQSIKIKLND